MVDADMADQAERLDLWECEICGHEYTTPEEADECEDWGPPY
jgi:hypothetical protein